MNATPTPPGTPTDDRDPLFATLRAAWQEWDPPPPDLVDTILVAIALDDLDADYELLTLVNRHDHLAGTRHAPDADRVLIEFRSAALTVLVRVSHETGGAQRLDGWVTPATGGSVTVVQGGHSAMAVIDSFGRFEVPGARPGLTRLLIAPHTDPAPTPREFRTTLFEI